MAEIEISADYWRKYAEEARTMADQMTTQGNQDTLLKIAAQYDKLASDAERRKEPKGRL